MHRFENHETGLVCNKCGRKIEMRGDIPLEDVFYAQKVWGYFSERASVIAGACVKNAMRNL